MYNGANLVFKVDGQEVHAVEGDFVNIPKGVVHGFTNKTDKKARILVVMAPSVEEYYLLEVGNPRTSTTPLPPTTPADVQKYLDVAPKYGIEYVFSEDQSSTRVHEGRLEVRARRRFGVTTSSQG